MSWESGGRSCPESVAVSVAVMSSSPRTSTCLLPTSAMVESLAGTSLMPVWYIPVKNELIGDLVGGDKLFYFLQEI